jgi:DNA-binding protein H-NS
MKQKQPTRVGRPLAAIVAADVVGYSRLMGLERKLSQLRAEEAPSRDLRPPYPPVLPKYRNPVRPSETWAGRGKQPRWLSDQLRSGKKLDEFLIKVA